MNNTFTCRRLLFVCILFTCMAGTAQTHRIDSLKKLLSARAAKPGRLETLLNLCAEKASLNPDSLYNYALEAKEMATATHDALNTSLAEYYIAFLLNSCVMPEQKKRCMLISTC